MVPNRAPQPHGAVPNVTVRVGRTAAVDASQYFTEPDGQALSYTARSSDSEVAGTSVAGSVVTVAAEAKGGTTVTITASDPGGLSAAQSFRLTVPNRSPAPVGVIDAQTIEAGRSVTLDVSASFQDPDGDALTYTAISLIATVAGASVSGSALTISAQRPGTTTVTITARDDELATATQLVSVTVPQPNRAPLRVGSIPDRDIRLGETATVDVSAYFSDPDGDALTYSASSSDAGIASVQVFGTTIGLSGTGEGRVTITVTAADPAGLEATQSFQVTVSREEEPPGSFEIDLRFATEMSASQRAVFESAQERWMAILADTELPDMPVPEGVARCAASEYEENVSIVDDLMIIAAVAEIDGAGNVVGQAGPCYIRSESRLPWLGKMVFDVADLDDMEASGILEAVILHEMGHVLGIGTLWRDLDLLRNPSLEAGREVDTHLPLPLAVEAFNQAGGVGYTDGGKVPVANRGTRPGSDDGHWRENVFGGELMIWRVTPSMPLSGITIASLADLGYAVRMDLADAYRLPSAAAVMEHRRRAIPLVDDILRIPIEVHDRNGRVVGVIRP